MKKSGAVGYFLFSTTAAINPDILPLLETEPKSRSKILMRL